MSALVLGIAGAKRSGKNTTCDLVREELEGRGLRVVEFSFAGRLKDTVAVMFGWERSLMDSGSREEIDPQWGISPRQALNGIGTDLIRDRLETALPGLSQTLQGATFWIKVFQNEFQSRLQFYDVVLISDVRFQDECRAIKELPTSQIWHVFRPVVSEPTGEIHACERFQQEMHERKLFDHQLINDQGIEELRSKVQTLLADITQGPGTSQHERTPPPNSTVSFAFFLLLIIALCPLVISMAWAPAI